VLPKEGTVKFVCPAHGVGPYYHACRHVRAACDAASPLPEHELGARTFNLVCQDCLSDDIVRRLTDDIARLLAGELDMRGSANAFQFLSVRFHELERLIGYQVMCANCLLERTGLDLGQHPLSDGGR
jgi:hypothetical protein